MLRSVQRPPVRRPCLAEISRRLAGGRSTRKSCLVLDRFHPSPEGKGEKDKGSTTPARTPFTLLPSPLYFFGSREMKPGGTTPRSLVWQGRGDLNSQPLVLETSALPIELHPYREMTNAKARMTKNSGVSTVKSQGPNYFRIFVTTPEPTVRPPSRMANRTLASMAMGEINSILSFTLSPGMHISAPPKSCAVPVTSVVRK
jgi:hypothetical protein